MKLLSCTRQQQQKTVKRELQFSIKVAAVERKEGNCGKEQIPFQSSWRNICKRDRSSRKAGCNDDVEKCNQKRVLLFTYKVLVVDGATEKPDSIRFDYQVFYY